MFLFSLPSLCDDALTVAGNHTFAAVKCSEGYDSLKLVLADMNELIKEGEIVVDGVTIKLLGSDMKFMLIVLELNAANSKYACMWCEVLNSKRLTTLCQHKQILYKLKIIDGTCLFPEINTQAVTCAHCTR